MDSKGKRLSQSQDPVESEAGRLLERAGQVTGWAPNDEARALMRLEERAARPSRRWGLALAIPVAAAAAVAVVALWRPESPAPVAVAPPARPAAPAWREVDLGEVGTLEVNEATAFRVPDEVDAQADERRVYLTGGKVRARIRKQDPARPFVVVTPQVRVVVVGTRFSVDVQSGGKSAVEVEEGVVRVESLVGGSVLLRAAERLLSDDPRLASPPVPDVEAPGAEEVTGAQEPRPRPGADPGCARERSLARRKACYERAAKRSDLFGENALYALGLLAREEEHDGPRALRYFIAYERRFPKGALGPEVAIGILRQMLSERRWGEALARAQMFKDAYGTDARAPEVSLIRANLWCTRFGRIDPALAAYDEALAARARPALRDEALFAKGACLGLLGRRAEAGIVWKQYLAEFPDGAHAEAVRRFDAKK